MFDLKIDCITSKYGERKHTGDVRSYSSRSTLMTRTTSGPAALLQVKRIQQSSEEASSWHAMLPSPQFAAGCFRVRGSFITCRTDALHVNDILCCIFLSNNSSFEILQLLRTAGFSVSGRN